MRLSALLIAFAVPSAVLAQGFPAPKPNEHHAVLKHDVGTWDCAVKMFLAGPTGPPSEFKGVEKSRLVSGGLHLVSEFECKMGERTFVGHGLSGYDPKSKKYIGTWVDNFTSGPVHTEGTYDAESKTMTVDSTVVDEDGNELKQRQVTVYTGEDRKTFTISLLIEVAGTEQAIKLMEMTCKRRKD